LETRGFDQCRKYGEFFVLGCSQCVPSFINGVPCHEHGCVNDTHECAGCNSIIPRRQKYCEDCR